MRTTYAIIVIGCVLILAAGLMAGCTGPAGTSPAPGTVVHPNSRVVSTTSVPVVTIPPASPAAGTIFPTVFVNSTANGRIVMIPVGERVLVRLDENPTTGYIWNATASKGLAVVADAYTAPETGLMGANGYHEWILSPQTVDTYTFRAVSLRPWEGAKPTDESFSLVLLVTKD